MPKGILGSAKKSSDAKMNIKAKILQWRNMPSAVDSISAFRGFRNFLITGANRLTIEY